MSPSAAPTRQPIGPFVAHIARVAAHPLELQVRSRAARTIDLQPQVTIGLDLVTTLQDVQRELRSARNNSPDFAGTHSSAPEPGRASARLLVVCARCPHRSQWRSSSDSTSVPQPPTPGLPMHAPSVWAMKCPGSVGGDSFARSSASRAWNSTRLSSGRATQGNCRTRRAFACKILSRTSGRKPACSKSASQRSGVMNG